MSHGNMKELIELMRDYQHSRLLTEFDQRVLYYINRWKPNRPRPMPISFAHFAAYMATPNYGTTEDRNNNNAGLWKCVARDHPNEVERWRGVLQDLQNLSPNDQVFVITVPGGTKPRTQPILDIVGQPLRKIRKELDTWVVQRYDKLAKSDAAFVTQDRVTQDKNDGPPPQKEKENLGIATSRKAPGKKPMKRRRADEDLNESNKIQNFAAAQKEVHVAPVGNGLSADEQPANKRRRTDPAQGSVSSQQQSLKPPALSFSAIVTVNSQSPITESPVAALVPSVRLHPSSDTTVRTQKAVNRSSAHMEGNVSDRATQCNFEHDNSFYTWLRYLTGFSRRAGARQ